MVPALRHLLAGLVLAAVSASAATPATRADELRQAQDDLAALRARYDDQHPRLAEARLRVSVSGGGCSGFQYQFALDDKSEDGDIVVERDGAALVVDGMSLMYVLGAELDFVEDLTGSYFKVTNPNASSSCGCGTSFAI